MPLVAAIPSAADHPLWSRWWERGYTEDILPYGAPARLYHYVQSWQSLMSILTTRMLWASDARQLNDSTELEHALPMCDEALDAIRDPALRPHAELVRSGLRNRFRYKTFVACFSAAGEIESQWDQYANHHGGFCIAFDNLLLSSLDAPLGLRIMPVEYVRAAQWNRVRAMVRRAVEDIQQAAAKTAWERQWAIQSRFVLLSAELFYVCTSLKAARWRTEHEWRIIYARQEREANALPIMTREAGTRQIEYVELDLRRTYRDHPIPTFAAVRPGRMASAGATALARRCIRDFSPETRWEEQPPPEQQLRAAPRQYSQPG